MSPRRRAPIAAAAALLLGMPAAHAQQQADRLTLDMSAAYRARPAAAAPSQPADASRAPEPAPEPAGEVPGTGPDHIPFGTAGSTWLTFGSAFAYDLGEEKDVNLHVAYSYFLANELEFAVQFSGWYFAQDADDTGGVSGQFFFRWHFWHADDWDWSVYGEAGIGLLAAFDEVPNGGQEFNFLPRATAGFTKRLWDDSPTRLQLGIGWHHISNGRYTGDVNNPSRDSVMVYAGIMIPF